MKKLLIFGIIFLFVGVCAQPAIGSISINNEIKKEEYKIYDNKDIKGLNFGFILVVATFSYPNSRQSYPLNGETVKCFDLETGDEIKREKTGYFGFCLFKFLPIRHDYKLTVSAPEGDDWQIVRNIGIWQRVWLDVSF